MAAQAWRDGGWPGPPRSIHDYEVIRTRLITYVVENFPDRVDVAQGRAIVDSTLTTFMAAVHARTNPTSPSPDDLVRAVEDAVLDHLAHRSPASHAVRGTIRDDAALLRRAFGEAVTPDIYRGALAELVAERRTLEFQIVTSHLEELEHPGRRPPVLATEQVVDWTLRDFRGRVTARTRAGPQ
jgi:hypothetical protein